MAAVIEEHVRVCPFVCTNVKVLKWDHGLRSNPIPTGARVRTRVITSTVTPRVWYGMVEVCGDG